MKNKSIIGVIIDSTTVMDPQLLIDYGIEVVSLNIHTKAFDKKELDTSNQEIIEQLEDVKNLASSSPSPLDFEEAYRKMFAHGYQHILCFPLSKELSSTFQSAMIGKDEFTNKDDIYVVDSLICNYGLANLIETILPLLENKEADFQEIITMTNERVKNSIVQFSVMNLRHLVNGGRLGKIAGLLGTILHIKPMIEMREGKLVLFKKEISMTKVMNVFMTTIKDYASRFKNIFVKVVDLMEDEFASKLLNSIKTTCPEIHLSRIRTVGPTFHIHLGNKGLGISVVAFDK